jgi:hypothetical protein
MPPRCPSRVLRIADPFALAAGGTASSGERLPSEDRVYAIAVHTVYADG